jgi:hypothetical protein
LGAAERGEVESETEREEEKEKSGGRRLYVYGEGNV